MQLNVFSGFIELTLLVRPNSVLTFIKEKKNKKKNSLIITLIDENCTKYLLNCIFQKSNQLYLTAPGR